MKKQKIFFYIKIVTISTAALLLFLFWYEPVYKGSIEIEGREDSPILLFAHRGFGNHAPDNSIVGAQMAIGHDLDGVDMDAQQSKDKKTFIFHDVSLERFTAGSGRVDEYTLAELQSFDLGIKYKDGSEFKNVFIESFEHFVQIVTPKAFLMVELKVSTPIDTGVEQDVINTIAKYNAFDSVYISSFNPVVLYRLKQIDSRVKTVFIFQDSGWDKKRVAETAVKDRVALPWYLRTEWTRRAIRKVVKPDLLSIHMNVPEETIQTLLTRGWPVFLWSLNDNKSLNWGIAQKPYGIVTDEPLLARKIYPK